VTERLRFNTRQAAEYAGKHRATIMRALECGELHGGQRKAGGHWSIRLACLEAWLDGGNCEHQGRKAS
jgi:hypothetical protein